MNRSEGFKTFIAALKDWCAQASDSELLTLADVVRAEQTKRGLQGPGTGSPPMSGPRPREGGNFGTREN